MGAQLLKSRSTQTCLAKNTDFQAIVWAQNPDWSCVLRRGFGTHQETRKQANLRFTYGTDYVETSRRQGNAILAILGARLSAANPRGTLSRRKERSALDYGLSFSIPYKAGASLYVNRAGFIAQAPPESTAIRSFETGS